MRWSSILLALLLTIAPAHALAEGVRPDLLPVVAPESIAITHQPLVARTLCSNDPTQERRWEVLNLTGEALTFTWQVSETGQSGTATLAGGAKTEVKATAKEGKLTLRLLVHAEVVATSPNWGTKCATQRPGQGLTWRQGPAPKTPARPAPPPKAPVRPAPPRPNQNLTWRKPQPPKAPVRPAPPRPNQGLTWQAPAPAPLVKVTPLCFRQPGERRWQVQNLTDRPLTLALEVEGRPSGDLVLAPRATHDLALEAGAPPHRLRLYEGGKLVAEAPSSTEPCARP